MKRRRCLLLFWWIALVAAAPAKDPGRDVIGRLQVVVFYGTDGDPAAAGERTQEVDEVTAERLRAQDQLRFGHYRLLGSDRKVVYRSYENWAQPIAGSDEVLCRFEVESRVSKESLRLDLELWLSRKKILKSGVALTPGKPVLVLGPEWRGGRLIISVGLEPKDG
jgi:hypothetical protein